MKEVWKNIKGYEGLYQVSNLGRVKSLVFRNNVCCLNKEKILSLNKQKKGYISVILCKNGKPKMFYVHRLVADAFIPNPNNLPQVNHKDENKENNCEDNLEFCTRKYNINYGTCREKIKKSCSKKIEQCDENGRVIKVWSSAKEASKHFGISNSTISQCAKGLHKHAGGFKWKYSKEDK